jgi:glycosyltransferase involved in cell wall biosynthesis
MRVGIEASNLRGGGGITHLLEVLRAADPQRHGFDRVMVWGPRSTIDQLPSSPWLEVSEPDELRHRMRGRVSWMMAGISRAAREVADVLLVPGGTYLGTFHPFVTMSRNMLPFDPDAARRYGWSLMRARVAALHHLQRRSYSRADGLIFLTETSRRLIEPQLPRVHGTSIVVPHGIGRRFLMAPRAQRDASESAPLRLVYVSIVDVYKHQVEVAEAVTTLRREGVPVTLDLIGPAYPPELRRLQRVLDRVDPSERYIRYRGNIPYAELPAVYAGADAFVFASSCENLPNILLEAMAAGLPIASSNKSVMPEVLGEAGVYFDPADPATIAASLRRLVEDAALRTRLASAAYARASQYSWERCAAATFAFLRDVHDRYHKRIA